MSTDPTFNNFQYLTTNPDEMTGIGIRTDTNQFDAGFLY
jgi:hypothetical protein